MAARSTQPSEVRKTQAYRDLRSTIYTFFYYSNRPVNGTEVMLQFKNHRKADVEQSLEDLVERGKIIKKIFSKSKFYCLAQDMEYEIDDPEYTDEADAKQDQNEEDKVLRFLRWKRTALSGALKELKQETAQLDEEIALLENQLSTEELKKAVDGMKRQLGKNGKMNEGKLVTETEMENQAKEMGMLNKELVKRKRIFKEAVDALCDGLDISKQALYDEVGIEN